IYTHNINSKMYFRRFSMDKSRNYKNYVFDLYGTLVDIHTDEEQELLWEKLALFYGYYDAVYEPER
ncbi:MAG: hypothetical protein ACLS9K_13090, partial [Lachnospira eligens]